MLFDILSSALLGAFIGWITNVMTIRLIFRPRNPWRLGGITIQGIIPRRRGEIARSLASTITRELLTAKDLWTSIDTPENRADLFNGVRRALRDRSGRLPNFPFKEAVMSRVEDMVIRELHTQMSHWAEDPALPQKILNRVPLESLVVNKIESFNLVEFEQIIMGLSQRELRQIEVLGGLLGFGVGTLLPLIQMLGRL